MVGKEFKMGLVGGGGGKWKWKWEGKRVDEKAVGGIEVGMRWEWVERILGNGRG